MLLFLFFSCLSIFFPLLIDGVGYYDIVWQHIGMLCSQDEFISYLMFMPQVLSVNLDEWTDEQVDTLADMGGNDAANLKYEASLYTTRIEANHTPSTRHTIGQENQMLFKHTFCYHGYRR